MGVIKTELKVTIGGQDRTSILLPSLEKVTVNKQAGQAADSAGITLNDPYGQVFLPQERSEVQIEINRYEVFNGFVDEVISTIDKSGGRKLEVTCSSVDQGSKAKEPKLKHKDSCTLEDAAKEFGDLAGLQTFVSGTIKSDFRDYWHMQNESFVSWGQRVARETGGTFKVQGKKAFLVGRNEGISVSGKKLTEIFVNAGSGGNLLSGSIAPIISRPKYDNVKVSYFDPDKAEYVEVSKSTPIDNVKTDLREVHGFANEDNAKQRTNSLSSESDRDQGQGDIDIIGNELAEPEAEVSVTGWRTGVDGTYRIHSVQLEVTTSGFVSGISVRQPKSGAGTDSR